MFTVTSNGLITQFQIEDGGLVLSPITNNLDRKYVREYFLNVLDLTYVPRGHKNQVD